MVHAETNGLAADPDPLQAVDVEWDAMPIEDVEASELPAELPTEDAAAEALCPTCGELLAWHDEFASCAAPAAAFPGLHVAPEAEATEFSQEPAAEVTERPRLFGRATPQVAFAYELGGLVQPLPAGPAQIIWRGQLKERHPATGLIHRVNVYRLNDGYWDCYREEELRAA